MGIIKVIGMYVSQRSCRMFSLLCKTFSLNELEKHCVEVLERVIIVSCRPSTVFITKQIRKNTDL